jgi:cytochrome P450
MTTAVDEVRIEDAHFYMDDPFPLYARLQDEQPFYYREDLRVWVMTRYDDCVRISKEPNLFSCKRGTLLYDVLLGRPLAEDYFGSDFILTSDPPRHNELRRVISPAFLPRRVAALEESVRQASRALVAALPANESVEYIGRVATLLPLVVTARLLGVKDMDTDQMSRWSDELMKIGSDMTEQERSASVEVFSEMNDFMRAQFAIKRAQPEEDLLSSLLAAELDDGKKISEDNALMWASLIISGGHETTRALLGNTVQVLGDFPAQRAVVVADPSMVTAALEEVMRWHTIARGFVRTVWEDTEYNGVQMRQGDWVYMLFQAANRDPRVFDNPQVFDITASRTKDNLTFGAGQHYCPGQQMARLEGRVMAEELLARFPTWHVEGGDPVVSTLRGAWNELHVTFKEA